MPKPRPIRILCQRKGMTGPRGYIYNKGGEWLATLDDGTPCAFSILLPLLGDEMALKFRLDDVHDEGQAARIIRAAAGDSVAVSIFE